MSVIKDSGDRTTYSTGAVRDMHAGKGRFDLMPIDVMAHQLKDDVLSDLAAFQNNPGDYGYLFQALHRFSKLAFESEETMLLETAIHFEDFKEALREKEPEIASMLVPNCVYRGFCPEMIPCGWWDAFATRLSREDILDGEKRYAKYNEWFDAQRKAKYEI